jgi:hypothetical protein
MLPTVYMAKTKPVASPARTNCVNKKKQEDYASTLRTSCHHSKLFLIGLHSIDGTHERAIVTVDTGIQSGDETEEVELKHAFRVWPNIALCLCICESNIVHLHDLLVFSKLQR